MNIQRITLPDDPYLSYGALIIYDASCPLPYPQIEEAHLEQGFARMDGVIYAITVGRDVTAHITVAFGAPDGLADYQRAVRVPLRVVSGVVNVEALYEDEMTRNFELEPGLYYITVARKDGLDEGEVFIDLFVEPTDEDNPRSRIIIADEEISRLGELIEDAEPISL